MAASKKSRPKPETTEQVPTMDESIVDFKKPPVTEVIFGIGFKRIAGFHSPHMGLFWNAIRKDFPLAEIRAPLTSPGEGPGLTFYEGTDAPTRYFLRSEDRTELVQVQPDRLLFNWLKTEADNPYPRYRGVMKRFLWVKRQFVRFLRENDFESPAVRELRLVERYGLEAG